MDGLNIPTADPVEDIDSKHTVTVSDEYLEFVNVKDSREHKEDKAQGELRKQEPFTVHNHTRDNRRQQVNSTKPVD